MTRFNPLADFVGGQSSALGLQSQRQGIQREAEAAPIRNQLAQIKLQKAKTGQQRESDQFDQQQIIKRATILNQSARALKNIDPSQRRAAFSALAPRLEGFGIDAQQIGQSDFNDQELDNAIASTQGLLDDPSALSNLALKQRTLDIRERELAQRGELLKQKPQREGEIVKAKLKAEKGLKAEVAGEVEEEKVIGKARGEAKVSLPQTLATANDSLAVIDSILSHPGLEGATGLASAVNPANFIIGTNEHDFALAAEQLQGQAFLQAFESLKGGGQITEVEGKQATNAIAQLSRKQSTRQYRKALRSLRDIVTRARDRAEDAASENSFTSSSGIKFTVE